jgi:dTDP-4-dehydrorhamnose 3,5-epimerase-like enzyme
MTIRNCKFIELPRINDPRGNLTFVESSRHLPFSINRVYYLSELVKGAARGGHAHRDLHQLIIPVSGSFFIHLDDGIEKKTIHLSKSDQGLYICPMIWREIDNFSENSVCLVLASEYYEEQDYYRNYAEFIQDIKRGANK